MRKKGHFHYGISVPTNEGREHQRDQNSVSFVLEFSVVYALVLSADYSCSIK